MSLPSHSIFADTQPIVSHNAAFAKFGFDFYKPGWLV
jgi:hypothetical protein